VILSITDWRVQILEGHHGENQLGAEALEIPGTVRGMEPVFSVDKRILLFQQKPGVELGLLCPLIEEIDLVK